MLIIKGGTYNGIEYSTMLEYTNGFLDEFPFATKYEDGKKLLAYHGVAHLSDADEVPAILWFNEEVQFVTGLIDPKASELFEVCFDVDDPDAMPGKYKCIKGLRKPTEMEAEDFLQKHYGLGPYDSVLSVDSISREEAEKYYDLSNEDEWPVFGVA